MINDLDNTRKTSGKSKWIIIFVLLLLLVFITISMLFNVVGIRDKVLSIVKKGPRQDTNTGKIMEESEARLQKEHFEAENIRLSALQSDLENYRAELDEKEKELEEREESLAEREQYLKRLEETFTQSYEDLEDLIKIYEKMDSEEAAAILSEIPDSEQVITIVKNINKEKAAEILGIMDPENAAEILSRLY